MNKLSELLKDYEEEDEDVEEMEYEEEEEEIENSEPFIIRMTKSYNFLVDAIEFMPPSMSKEYKFKKDIVKAKNFYLKLTGLTKDYHIFLKRMTSLNRGA